MRYNLLGIIAARQLPNEGFTYVSPCPVITYNAHIYIDGPGTSSKNQMFLSWPWDMENEEKRESTSLVKITLVREYISSQSLLDCRHSIHFESYIKKSVKNSLDSLLQS